MARSLRCSGRAPIQRRTRRIAVIFAVLPALLTAAPAAERAPGASVRMEGAPGLQKAVFGTPQGRVTVHYPDDARAGDTLSGVVLAEPEGDTDKKRQKARDRLSGLVVEMAGQRAKVSDGQARWSIPAGAGTVLRLLDSSGQELARTPVPVQAPHEFATLPGVVEDRAALVQTVKPTPGRVPGSRTPPASVSPEDFRLPSGGQAGRNVTCDGPFDGDLATTALTLGGKPVRLLAEGPRKLVFESPASITGPAALRLKERDVETTAAYRSLAVALAASTTQLTRGQTTTLAVTVSGLSGLSEEVPLQLQKSGAVSMSGGDEQVITIKPSDVGPAGSCSFERTLTGLQAGSFGVVATVRVPEPVIRLIAPANGATLREARPRFAWTVEHAPAGLAYAVKLVEAAPGSPLDETVHASAHSVGRDIAATTWVYPPDAPPLRPGASYAVVVKGVRDGAVVALSGPGGFLFRPDDDPCAHLRLRVAELEGALARERGRDLAGDAEQARAEAEKCEGDLEAAREELAAAERSAKVWAINQKTPEGREGAQRAAQKRDEKKARVADLEARCAAAKSRRAELEQARAGHPDAVKRLEQELEEARRLLAECEARAKRDADERKAQAEAERVNREAADALKQQQERTRTQNLVRDLHLLSNLHKLGMKVVPSYEEYEKTEGFRGLWDALPGVLGVIHGVAAETFGSGPIPTDAVTAMGGMAALASQFRDPCKDTAQPHLAKIVEGEMDHEGKPYNYDRALEKVRDLCELLRRLERIAAGAEPR